MCVQYINEPLNSLQENVHGKMLYQITKAKITARINTISSRIYEDITTIQTFNNMNAPISITHTVNTNIAILFPRTVNDTTPKYITLQTFH